MEKQQTQFIAFGNGYSAGKMEAFKDIKDERTRKYLQGLYLLEGLELWFKTFQKPKVFSFGLKKKAPMSLWMYQMGYSMPTLAEILLKEKPLLSSKEFKKWYLTN